MSAVMPMVKKNCKNKNSLKTITKQKYVKATILMVCVCMDKGVNIFTLIKTKFIKIHYKLSLIKFVQK